MSTILKALRRLEEEDSKGGGSAGLSSPSPSPSQSPSTGSEVLRERILTEEKAAEAFPDQSRVDRRWIRKLVLVGSVSVAFLLLGLIASRSFKSDDASIVAALRPGARDRSVIAAEIPAVASPAAPLEVSAIEKRRAGSSPAHATLSKIVQPPAPDARRVDGAVRASPSSTTAAARPSPPVAASSLATAEVTPTPAVTAASSGVRNIKSLPIVNAERSLAGANPSLNDPSPSVINRKRRPTQGERAPTASVSGASVSPKFAPDVASASSPRISESRPLDASATAVERIDHRGLPDVVVLRTSWHPSADRRSAKIRIVATDETLQLHEGDAVGGLVIQEITPSSVLFEAGGVEIRRKVGNGNR